MTTREGKALPFQSVLPTHAAGVQEGVVTPVVLYDQNGNAIGANEPLVYAALVTQAGVANPTAVVAKNNTGEVVTWARTDVGTYTATASGSIFTAGKTIILTGSDDVDTFRTSTEVLTITTSADDVLSGSSFKVEVYP